jgi:hypothetical protein
MPYDLRKGSALTFGFGAQAFIEFFSQIKADLAFFHKRLPCFFRWMMDSIENISKVINRDYALLAPIVRDRAKIAVKRCWDKFLRVEIFEGWRSPQRQNELYAQGRTTPGKIVTQSRAWQSFHQLGLAIDLAFLKQPDGGWTWEGDWDEASEEFTAQGFKSLAPLERAHFQITGGFTIAKANQIAAQYGLPGLWLAVAKEFGK